MERLANQGVKSINDENGHLICNIIGDVYIHPSAIVHATATLGPNVSIGPGVTIGQGVRIRESIILDNAVIQNHTLVIYSIGKFLIQKLNFFLIYNMHTAYNKYSGSWYNNW